MLIITKTTQSARMTLAIQSLYWSKPPFNLEHSKTKAHRYRHTIYRLTQVSSLSKFPHRFTGTYVVKVLACPGFRGRDPRGACPDEQASDGFKNACSQLLGPGSGLPQKRHDVGKAAGLKTRPTPEATWKASRWLQHNPRRSSSSVGRM